MKHAKTMIQQAILLGILIFGTWGFGGCTYLGYAIGSEIDDARPERDTLYPDREMNPEPGDDVQVMLKDSTVVEGEYAGLEMLDASDYAARYRSFVNENENTNFPMPGDSLIWHISATRVPFVSVFRGFGARSMMVQMVNQSAIENLPFDRPTSMEMADGTSLDLSMLAYESASGRLPRNLSVLVETESDTTRIPLDDIAMIERLNSNNARWIGGGIGLAVDAWFWLVVVSRGPLFDFGFGGGFGGGKW